MLLHHLQDKGPRRQAVLLLLHNPNPWQNSLRLELSSNPHLFLLSVSIITSGWNGMEISIPAPPNFSGLSGSTAAAEDCSWANYDANEIYALPESIEANRGWKEGSYDGLPTAMHTPVSSL